MIIVLLGYMGSGKSSVGQLLAKEFGFCFKDLDDIIAEKESMTIPEIFKSKGEIYFRKKETQYLSELLHKEDNIVLALGGGTPCYANNMALIAESKAQSVYLKTSIPQLLKRLRVEKEQRPLINHLTSDEELTEFIGKHLFERQQFYNQALFAVSTDNQSLKAIVSEVRFKLED